MARHDQHESMLSRRRLLAGAGVLWAFFIAAPCPAPADDGGAAVSRFMPLMIETSGRIITIRAEVADTMALRRRGLMHRQRLPRGRGMLLLWERPSMAALWMKNTLVPLDMIFIAAGGRIVHIHENARPGDLTPISAGQPVLAVLEMAAGEARRLGLKKGNLVTLPCPGEAR